MCLIDFSLNFCYPNACMPEVHWEETYFPIEAAELFQGMCSAPQETNQAMRENLLPDAPGTGSGHKLFVFVSPSFPAIKSNLYSSVDFVSLLASYSLVRCTPHHILQAPHPQQ